MLCVSMAKHRISLADHLVQTCAIITPLSPQRQWRTGGEERVANGLSDMFNSLHPAKGLIKPSSAEAEHKAGIMACWIPAEGY